MKKIYLIIWMLLFMSSILFAQTTVVSATVVDSDGISWANGTWKVSFITNGQNTDINKYNQDGVPLSQSVMFQNGVMDNTGFFSFLVYDSSTITPSGSQWTLTVCPLSSAPCGIYTFSTAGAALDISGALTFIIPPPRFTGVQGTYGYADLEVIPTKVPGSTYYNVVSQCQRYFNSQTSIWTCASSGGGGGTVNYVDNEVPQGVVDGVNLVFTLNHTPNPPGSLILVNQGLIQWQNSSGDFTLSGLTITFTSAPTLGPMIAWYRY